jgi:hypothetical protein
VAAPSRQMLKDTVDRRHGAASVALFLHVPLRRSGLDPVVRNPPGARRKPGTARDHRIVHRRNAWSGRRERRFGPVPREPDAEATGTLRTLDGKVVAKLNGGAPGRAHAGRETTLRWDGRNTDGTQVAFGPYQVEISVRTPEGDTVQVKRPVFFRR